MKQHANIPIFIPHLGCPNQCVFCNQRHISGVRSFEAKEVIPTIEAALATIPRTADTEIAFFGGSFTGIERNLMIELLEIASYYLKNGRVGSIRCSTRPDYIDSEVLDILMHYGVGTIELGLQSVSEDVLSMCKRGHAFRHEADACRMITERGISLVGQMMIGLPGSTPDTERATAEFIVSSGATGARIYPTVVFKDTELCDMAAAGEYVPLRTEEAVERSAEVLEIFNNAGINVIRIGLCASENLAGADSYYAGPNHPALGEMIISRLFYKRAVELLKTRDFTGNVPTLLVPRGSMSKAIGQKKENKIRLISEFGLADIKFKESDALGQFELKLECEGDT